MFASPMGRGAFVQPMGGEAAASASLGLLTNLVAWWELDEASGNRADSHTNALTLTDNNTVGSATGIGGTGTAALFDAGSEELLSRADNALLDFSTVMSFSLWFYWNGTVNMTLGGKWNYPSNASWMVQTHPSISDELIIFVATSISDDGSGCNITTTNADLAINTWHNLTMVYDGALSAGDRVRIYINGTLRTISISGTAPTSLVNSAAAFELGRFGGLDRFFTGRQQKAALWNEALSQSQVTALYNSGAGRTYSEL